MIKEQYESITQWQSVTFSKATALSKIAHLAEELSELVVELQKTPAPADPKNKRLEFADCFILLFGAASSDGMTYENIVDAIEEKMAINKARRWGEPNKNGVVNHIREEDGKP